MKNQKRKRRRSGRTLVETPSSTFGWAWYFNKCRGANEKWNDIFKRFIVINTKKSIFISREHGNKEPGETKAQTTINTNASTHTRKRVETTAQAEYDDPRALAHFIFIIRIWSTNCGFIFITAHNKVDNARKWVELIAAYRFAQKCSLIILYLSASIVYRCGCHRNQPIRYLRHFLFHICCACVRVSMLTCDSIFSIIDMEMKRTSLFFSGFLSPRFFTRCIFLSSILFKRFIWLCLLLVQRTHNSRQKCKLTWMKRIVQPSTSQLNVIFIRGFIVDRPSLWKSIFTRRSIHCVRFECYKFKSKN